MYTYSHVVDQQVKIELMSEFPTCLKSQLVWNPNFSEILTFVFGIQA